MMDKILLGGLLGGYRTYILGGLMVVQALAAWGVGDMTLPGLLTKLPELLAGLGFMTIRAGIDNATKG